MLDALFFPKSVAVIGASTKELSIGNRIIKNLQEFGFKGPIYPINPKGEDVRGIKSYKSILEVPGEVTLAHMVIPNKLVPAAIDDCGKKGVKVVIINSAGFKEVGGEGEALERQVVEKARAHGIRVFGPNCQGIINTDPAVRAYCNFTFTRPETGNISIVAQSGGVAEVINQRFSELGAGIRMYASNGNACDVSIDEVIRYWGDDEATKVIVLYVEGLANPKRFMEVAREVAAKKPILGMKAGRTQEGAKAASSHTGGLAKLEMATELMFEKVGIVTFRDEEELCQAAVAFANVPVPKGNRVGMITNTGGPAIIATDILVEGGLAIPPLSKRAEEFLTPKLYEAASVNNPIDVLATANGDHFRAALDALMDEETIDSVYINFVTPFFVDTEAIARQIAEVARAGKKPIVCNLMTDRRQWTGTIDILRKGNVPTFAFPETAARALVAMTRYRKLRDRNVGKVQAFKVDRAGAERIVAMAARAGRENLSAEEVYGVLKAYGISAADWRLARDPDEAAAKAKELGFPVVLKADSSSVVHKTEKGGVLVNLKTAEEVKAAAQAMKGSIAAPDLRFFVQRFVPNGKEFIVGAIEEGAFGHLVMFGMGGIGVEVMKDVSFGLAPITPHEADGQITGVKSYQIIKGFRGHPGVDQQALSDIIQRVSQLATDIPAIREMDLNPIMAFEKGASAVDARIRIRL